MCGGARWQKIFSWNGLDLIRTLRNTLFEFILPFTIDFGLGLMEPSLTYLPRVDIPP